MKSILTSLFSLVLCATLHAQIPSYVPADGLVGWWPFNGNANDESGNGNHGVVNGATLAEDRFGNAGSAYFFDGASNGNKEYIDLLSPTLMGAFQSDFTVSLWFRGMPYDHPLHNGNSFGAGCLLDCYSSDHNFYPFRLDVVHTNSVLDTNSFLKIYRRCPQENDEPLSSFSIERNNWHSVIVRNNSSLGHIDISFDGQEIFEMEFDYSISNEYLVAGLLMQIGSMTQGHDQPFHQFFGTIDDIAIYNRILTNSEEYQIYSGSDSSESLCAPLAPNLQNGLVGYWPFCGNANDESGNGNNGVVNGATLAEDRFGNANAAYSFDGVDDYIFCPNVINQFSSSFSVSGWFRLNDLNPQQQNQYDFVSSWTQGCGQLLIRFDTYQGNPVIAVNSHGFCLIPFNEVETWHHFTVTSSDTGTLLYLDGQYASQSDSSAPLSSCSNFMNFGRQENYNGIGYMNGLLDDIAIYNRALTPAEITQLYTAAEEPVATCAPLAPNLQNGLVGYWPFCGNANDESGNGNNGVVNGATLAEDRFGNVGSAYSFDGVNDNFTLPNINGIYGMSFWVKINEFNDNDYLLDARPGLENGWVYYALGDNDFGIGWDFKYVNGAIFNSELTNFPLNTWTHVYLSSNTPFNDDISFMTSYLNSPGSMSGTLDDIAIYNRALTPAEITQLYTAAEEPAGECNLIASETQDTPIEVGGSAQLYVTLNATDYSMQWQTNAAGLGWMDVQDNNTYTGSQTQNLLISNATLANHEQPFRIIVTDGICNDTSDVALLLVNNTCTAFDTITTTVEVFDTLTIENVVEVYDTLTIYNTIDVFDTTNVTVEVFDTITNVIDVFDTTTVYLQVDIYDTLFIDVYDTTYIQQTIDVYDTTYVTLTDTTYIQVIDTAYVTVTDTLLIDITFVGFEGQPSWLNTVLVYPNPASDHITIDYGNFALMAGYNTVITDAAGATVYSSAVNTQQATIDINAWGAAGVYYLSVYDVNGAVVAVRQIILE